MVNGKMENCQFKVGQDILMNHLKFHMNRLGSVVALAPKAVGPFNIKMQITQNTFEIDIPAAVRKKMRMRSTSHYQRVRIDLEITVLQLPQPPPEEADVLPV